MLALSSTLRQASRGFASDLSSLQFHCDIIYF